MTLEEKLKAAKESHKGPVDAQKAYENKGLSSTPKTMGQTDSGVNIHKSQPVEPKPVEPNWSIQGKLNDYAKANPYAPTEEIVNTVKDNVGYNKADDKVYDTFYGYHKPKTSNITINRSEKSKGPTESDKINTESAKFDLEQKKSEIDKQNKEQQAIDEQNKSSDGIYSQLIAGTPISSDLKNTPAYKQANKRFTDFNKYNSMNASQLSYAISGGELLPGTDLYNDLSKTDPAKIRKAENSAKIEKLLGKDTIGVGDITSVLSKQILSGFLGDTNDLKSNISGNEEVIKLTEEAKDQKNIVDDLKMQIDNAESDLIDELKGTGATTAYKNALLNQRLKGFYKQYDRATNIYNNTIGALKQTTDNIKYDYEQSKANNADALRGLETLYSISSKERDYNNTSVKGNYDIKEVGNTTYKINKNTGNYEVLNGGTNGNPSTGAGSTLINSDPQGILDYSMNKRGRNNLQCGELVNDYIKKSTGENPQVRFGSTYQSKVEAINNIGKSDVPVVGGLFAYNTSTGTGHTGIVKSVDNNGNITVMEANRKGDGKTIFGKYTSDKTKDMIFSENPQQVKEDMSNSSVYTRYVEDNMLPTGLKYGTEDYYKFVDNAKRGYIESKNKVLQQKGFNIINKDAYLNTDKKTKDNANESIQNIKSFVSSMNNLIKLTNKYGRETTLTEAGSKMKQSVINAQMQAKEIYNLGVLNGNDYKLLQDVLYDPTSLTGIGLAWQDPEELVKNGRDIILNNVKAKLNSMGIGVLPGNALLETNDIKSTDNLYGDKQTSIGSMTHKYNDNDVNDLTNELMKL